MTRVEEKPAGRGSTRVGHTPGQNPNSTRQPDWDTFFFFAGPRFTNVPVLPCGFLVGLICRFIYAPNLSPISILQPRQFPVSSERVDSETEITCQAEGGAADIDLCKQLCTYFFVSLAHHTHLGPNIQKTWIHLLCACAGAEDANCSPYQQVCQNGNAVCAFPCPSMLFTVDEVGHNIPPTHLTLPFLCYCVCHVQIPSTHFFPIVPLAVSLVYSPGHVGVDHECLDGRGALDHGE
jgi:hypothetical protein